MPNGNLQRSSELNVPTYLPLSDAAKKFNLSEKALTQLVKAGKIEAVQLPSGELLVAAEDNGKQLTTKDEIIAGEFAHLRELPITVSQAAENYDLPRNTILEWVKRKYITVLESGYCMKLDEADVAYCAKIYKEKLEEYSGQLRGVNIFDEYGNPYRLMHPKLSKKRRSKKYS